METTGKIRRIEVQKTAPFIVVESLDVPPEHTFLHPIRCFDSPQRFEWIMFSCLALFIRCQNSKSAQYPLTSGSKVIG
jgi:hypothetical protein